MPTILLIQSLILMPSIIAAGKHRSPSWRQESNFDKLVTSSGDNKDKKTFRFQPAENAVMYINYPKRTTVSKKTTKEPQYFLNFMFNNNGKPKMTLKNRDLHNTAKKLPLQKELPLRSDEASV
ncbi:uncharacterized protein LOC108602687 [Drosophila busckii]|uniref:uncharacterized protein LOC108602687 n=1 Tax=Drosophila busckii TaxID=30019 RepID=UPI00083EDF46|nr:uncharacterized protein LOC108602687 [Drosophila busckii]